MRARILRNLESESRGLPERARSSAVNRVYAEAIAARSAASGERPGGWSSSAANVTMSRSSRQTTSSFGGKVAVERGRRSGLFPLSQPDGPLSVEHSRSPSLFVIPGRDCWRHRARGFGQATRQRGNRGTPAASRPGRPLAEMSLAAAMRSCLWPSSSTRKESLKENPEHGRAVDRRHSASRRRERLRRRRRQPQPAPVRPAPVRDLLRPGLRHIRLLITASPYSAGARRKS